MSMKVLAGLAGASLMLIACASTPSAEPPHAPMTSGVGAPASRPPPVPTGKACSLDEPNSCPQGQTCRVPTELPTRNGNCQ